MASNGRTTPASAQRHVPARADSTKAAEHKMPVSGAGPLTMSKRSATPAVTGPSAWENGRDQTAVVGGAALRGATASSVHPCPPGSGNCP